MKYCDESVRMSVCLSAHADLKPAHAQTSRHFLYMLYLWPWLGPPLTTRQDVMYFRFVNDVTMSDIWRVANK